MLKERQKNEQGVDQVCSARELIKQLRDGYDVFQNKQTLLDSLQQAQTNVEKQELAKQLSTAMQDEDRRKTSNVAESQSMSDPAAYDNQVELLAEGLSELELAVVVEGAALEKLGIGVKKANGTVTKLVESSQKLMSGMRENQAWSPHGKEQTDISCEKLWTSLAPKNDSMWMSLESAFLPETEKELARLVQLSEDCLVALKTSSNWESSNGEFSDLKEIVSEVKAMLGQVRTQMPILALLSCRPVGHYTCLYLITLCLCCNNQSGSSGILHYSFCLDQAWLQCLSEVSV